MFLSSPKALTNPSRKQQSRLHFCGRGVRGSGGDRREEKEEKARGALHSPPLVISGREVRASGVFKWGGQQAQPAGYGKIIELLLAGLLKANLKGVSSAVSI